MENTLTILKDDLECMCKDMMYSPIWQGETTEDIEKYKNIIGQIENNNIEIFLLSLTKEDFYEIAKIIDNDFIGAKKFFICQYDNKYKRYDLTTNKCDEASLIRVYNNGTIERMSYDTEGFKKINQTTYYNVFEWVLNNKDIK